MNGMSNIDTSTAALRKLAEHGLGLGYKEEAYSVLRAVAAEKEAQHKPEQASPDERHLRRLLALRAAIPGTYFDDGEAHGTQHGISIDFMREPVADIDAKLRALNVARMECSKPEQHHIADASNMVAPADVPLPEPCGVLDVYNMENVYKHSDFIANREAYAAAKVAAAIAAQPKPAPVLLTLDEINDIWHMGPKIYTRNLMPALQDFARAIESAVLRKNGGVSDGTSRTPAAEDVLGRANRPCRGSNSTAFKHSSQKHACTRNG